VERLRATDQKRSAPAIVKPWIMASRLVTCASIILASSPFDGSARRSSLASGFLETFLIATGVWTTTAAERHEIFVNMAVPRTSNELVLSVRLPSGCGVYHNAEREVARLRTAGAGAVRMRILEPDGREVHERSRAETRGKNISASRLGTSVFRSSLYVR
jgi:hypothetical protein